MKKNLVIALDGMGGDHAPRIVIDGAARAFKKYPDTKFIIYGDAAEISPLLEKHAALKTVVELRHTPDRVMADDKPAMALRQGRNSSMRLAIDAVASGEADCVVSAGNTGALMALAKFSLKVLPGIDRPAIASALPTKIKGQNTVLMDLGANAACDANNLLEFAVLGGVYAREKMGIAQPRIGILNIGSEAMKGSDLVQASAELFAKAELPGIYTGFAEGDDIASGNFDVIVTDGFTGNVTLKTIEGTARLIKNMFKQSFQQSFMMKLAAILCIPAFLIAFGAFKALYKRIDPRYYNGACFLGLKGLCIKSHGGTDAVGFANAISVAADLAQHEFNQKVAAELVRIGHGVCLSESAEV